MEPHRPEITAQLARPPISAIITTYNRKRHLAGCIESVSWCDEILIVDSFSTDGTVEMVGAYEKVRLLQRRYLGSAAQKNWAMDHARHDWMLILDDDERCTAELRNEIENILSSSAPHEAYTVHRRTYVLGEVIRFSGWQNNRTVRLLKHRAGRCPNLRAHGGVVPRAPAPSLRHPLEHFMVEDLVEYSERVRTYAYWSAAQLWRDGRSVGVTEVAIRSVWRFLRTYVLRLGLLDGGRGLVFCLLQGYGTYLKWSFLWSWRAAAETGVQPVLPEFDEDERTWAASERMSTREERRRKPRRPLRHRLAQLARSLRETLRPPKMDKRGRSAKPHKNVSAPR